jgi:CheY-like chemotaxis protein
MVPKEFNNSPLLILIVDDDAVIREMLEIALRSFGFTVETAASGDEALSALRRGPVDLVVRWTPFSGRKNRQSK